VKSCIDTTTKGRYTNALDTMDDRMRSIGCASLVTLSMYPYGGRAVSNVCIAAVPLYAPLPRST
jgi:hypothetical protein